MIEDRATISRIISEIMLEAILENFCYSGIITLNFAMNQPYKGIEYFSIDIAVGFYSGDDMQNKHFSTNEFFKSWGEKIKQVEILDDLSLVINFENSCQYNICSFYDDAENVVDLRWALYDTTRIKNGIHIWVESTQSIFMFDKIDT